MGKKAIACEWLIQELGCQFWGCVLSRYFDAQFECALMGRESERRAVSHKVLPGTCMALCHHTASVPLLARSHGWGNPPYFMHWGKRLSRGKHCLRQTLSTAFSIVPILPALFVLGEQWCSPSTSCPALCTTGQNVPLPNGCSPLNTPRPTQRSSLLTSSKTRATNAGQLCQLSQRPLLQRPEAGGKKSN